MSPVTAACNLKIFEFLGKLMKARVQEYKYIFTAKIILSLVGFAFFLQVTETDEEKGKVGWILLITKYIQAANKVFHTDTMAFHCLSEHVLKLQHFSSCLQRAADPLGKHFTILQPHSG